MKEKEIRKINKNSSPSSRRHVDPSRPVPFSAYPRDSSAPRTDYEACNSTDEAACALRATLRRTNAVVSYLGCRCSPRIENEDSTSALTPSTRRGHRRGILSTLMDFLFSFLSESKLCRIFRKASACLGLSSFLKDNE